MKIPMWMFPILNPIVAMLLRSPLHAMMSGDVMLLIVTGRKSAKQVHDAGELPPRRGDAALLHGARRHVVAQSPRRCRRSRARTGCRACGARRGHHRSARAHPRRDRGVHDAAAARCRLSGKAMEERIEPTVRDLTQRVRPRVVAPGHCTGWRAKAALAHAFAPGRYGPSVVGTSYVLTAQPA